MEENNSIRAWVVIVGIIIVCILIWLLTITPKAIVEPVFIPGNDTTTEKTIIKEKTKEVLVTPEATPTVTASPTATPTIK